MIFSYCCNSHSLAGEAGENHARRFMEMYFPELLGSAALRAGVKSLSAQQSIVTFYNVLSSHFVRKGNVDI